MRILMIHGYYRDFGGEDVVYQNERYILEKAGHDVFVYERQNSEIDAYSVLKKLASVPRMYWNNESAREVGTILKTKNPELVHCTNTFPLISPSVYYVCQEASVPIVQNVQNYRHFCPGLFLLRDGKICEACLGRSVAWPGVVHACYRGSRLKTSAVAGMLAFHNWMRTWQKLVDRYVAVTDFSKRKLTEGGLPGDKITVKPNFLHIDPGKKTETGAYALFVGRLSPEKGVLTLVEAWRSVPAIPLKIVGEGPLHTELRERARSGNDHDHIEFLGFKSRGEVIALMKGARFLLFPSEWHEGFPLTLIEAFGCGLPVVASRIGNVAEIVTDQRTGLHFSPGVPDDLADKVRWLWEHRSRGEQMGREARAEYEEKYTAERNYEMLMRIYDGVLSRNRTRKGSDTR